MRELIGFAKLESNNNIVRFGESFDSSPKLDFVEIALLIHQLSSSTFQSHPESIDGYLSSTLRVNPTVCIIYTCSSSLLKSIPLSYIKFAIQILNRQFNDRSGIWSRVIIQFISSIVLIMTIELSFSDLDMTMELVILMLAFLLIIVSYSLYDRF